MSQLRRDEIGHLEHKIRQSLEVSPQANERDVHVADVGDAEACGT